MPSCLTLHAVMVGEYCSLYSPDLCALTLCGGGKPTLYTPLNDEWHIILNNGALVPVNPSYHLLDLSTHVNCVLCQTAGGLICKDLKI